MKSCSFCGVSNARSPLMEGPTSSSICLSCARLAVAYLANLPSHPAASETECPHCLRDLGGPGHAQCSARLTSIVKTWPRPRLEALLGVELGPDFARKRRERSALRDDGEVETWLDLTVAYLEVGEPVDALIAALVALERLPRDPAVFRCIVRRFFLDRHRGFDLQRALRP